MNLPPDLRNRVLQAVQQHPAAPRPVARRRRLAAGGLTVIVYVALLAAIGLAPDDPRPDGHVLTTAVGLVALALGALLVSLRRGSTMTGPPVGVRLAFLGGGVAGWALLLGALYAAWPETTALESPRPLPLGCWLLTLLFAAAPLTLLVVLRRGAEAVSPGATAATVSLAAALAGTLGATLHCPYAGLVHQLVGHGLPLVALTALGAWALAPWLSVRRGQVPGPRR